MGKCMFKKNNKNKWILLLDNKRVITSDSKIRSILDSKSNKWKGLIKWGSRKNQKARKNNLLQKSKSKEKFVNSLFLTNPHPDRLSDFLSDVLMDLISTEAFYLTKKLKFYIIGLKLMTK